VIECGVVAADFHKWSAQNLQDDLGDAEYFQDNAGHMEAVIRALLAMKAEADGGGGGGGRRGAIPAPSDSTVELKLAVSISPSVIK
jgi:hypothetical protein